MDNDRVLVARFLGTDVRYGDAMALMRSLHARVANHESAHQLLLLEHAPVITITQQHQNRSLLSTVTAINRDGIEVEVADRGGDATFHGPGQIVGYPIIRCGESSLLGIAQIERFVRGLEEALLNALSALGLKGAFTLSGFTGIWYRHEGRLRKLAAIGVGMSNGVTKHGFALNTRIDAQPFLRHMIPCGLKDRGIITLQEAFFLEHLSLPDDWVMLAALAESLAQQFSLTLTWHQPDRFMTSALAQGL